MTLYDAGSALTPMKLQKMDGVNKFPRRDHRSALCQRVQKVTEHTRGVFQTQSEYKGILTPLKPVPKY